MTTNRICSVLLTALFVVAMSVTAQQKKSPPAKKETAKMDNTANPVVAMKTSMGTITIELYPEKAPITVKNFLSYVDEKFFDGTIFHRVMGNFMIQGGGFTPDMKQKETKAPIVIESKNGLKNDRGMIAMARTPEPNSATSQFFINVVDNPNLNPGGYDPNGYAVFGKVIDGMDVVDKIKAVKTTTKMPHQNVPVDPVMIESVRRAETKKK